MNTQALWDILYSADVWLFYAGNIYAANPVFDVVMPIITSNMYTVPFFVVVLLGLLWKGKREDRLFVLVLLVTIIVLDQCIVLIKEPIGRLRPCNTLATIHLLIDCGTGKSFPSAHAANNTAFALIVAYFYARFAVAAAFWAVLVAYSRVYCGVHYPVDILGGAVMACVMTFAIIRLWRVVFRRSVLLQLPPPVTRILRFVA